MAKTEEVEGQTDLFDDLDFSDETSDETEVKTEKKGRGRPKKKVLAKKQSFFIEQENDEILSAVASYFGMTKSRFINRLCETAFKELIIAIGNEEHGTHAERARKTIAFYEKFGFNIVDDETRMKILNTLDSRRESMQNTNREK
ncbi:MAG: hypothetical protein SPK94_08470 [Bacteroidales bacterium]|nr:hypothetical protein [Bacteroidales bacterium]